MAGVDDVVGTERNDDGGYRNDRRSSLPSRSAIFISFYPPGGGIRFVNPAKTGIQSGVALRALSALAAHSVLSIGAGPRVLDHLA